MANNGKTLAFLFVVMFNVGVSKILRPDKKLQQQSQSQKEASEGETQLQEDHLQSRDEIVQVIESIIQRMDISVDETASWQQKLESIEAYTRKMIAEVEFFILKS